MSKHNDGGPVTLEMKLAGMKEWDKAHDEGVRDWMTMLERVYLAMLAARGGNDGR